MSMRDFPNRTQIEQAETLEFNRPTGPTITIHGTFNGWPIEATFTGRLEQLPAAIDRLQALGVVPAAPSPSQAAQKPKRKAVEPEYDQAGNPCCPKHHRILKIGQYGPYCPAKDDTTERGFCALKFAE